LFRGCDEVLHALLLVSDSEDLGLNVLWLNLKDLLYVVPHAEALANALNNIDEATSVFYQNVVALIFVVERVIANSVGLLDFQGKGSHDGFSASASEKHAFEPQSVLGLNSAAKVDQLCVLEITHKRLSDPSCLRLAHASFGLGHETHHDTDVVEHVKVAQVAAETFDRLLNQSLLVFKEPFLCDDFLIDFRQKLVGSDLPLVTDRADHVVELLHRPGSEPVNLIVPEDIVDVLQTALGFIAAAQKVGVDECMRLQVAVEVMILDEVEL
jgi:hypothetical protein